LALYGGDSIKCRFARRIIIMGNEANGISKFEKDR
jgi:hypothetical protein